MLLFSGRPFANLRGINFLPLRIGKIEALEKASPYPQGAENCEIAPGSAQGPGKRIFPKSRNRRDSSLALETRLIDLKQPWDFEAHLVAAFFSSSMISASGITLYPMNMLSIRPRFSSREMSMHRCTWNTPKAMKIYIRKK